MTPRVLLLQEDQATGGVTTITGTLCQALRQQGWQVSVVALNRSSWREQLRAARDCDVILASHNFRPAYIGSALGLIWRKPVIVWVHGPLQEVLDQDKVSFLKRTWLRWLYGRLRRFVFVSHASRESFERFMNRAMPPGQGHVVIPNAVTLSQPAQQDVADAGQQQSPETHLAYIGRLAPEKQPLLLLDMLRLLPARFRLTLVGDGPMRNTVLQAGADLLDCGRLTLTGVQPHGPGLYTPWQATLLASRYEGCPMTLLESLAMGVPCVSLPIPAAREVLGSDAAYLQALDDTAQALADAVLLVHARPRQEMRADMARVLARHGLQDFVQRWQTVLLEAARPC